MLASPRFAYDYYLRSLSETALGKHCEQLMKSSERYLQVKTGLFPDGVVQEHGVAGASRACVNWVDRFVIILFAVQTIYS